MAPAKNPPPSIPNQRNIILIGVGDGGFQVSGEVGDDSRSRAIEITALEGCNVQVSANRFPVLANGESRAAWAGPQVQRGGCAGFPVPDKGVAERSLGQGWSKLDGIGDSRNAAKDAIAIDLDVVAHSEVGHAGVAGVKAEDQAVGCVGVAHGRDGLTGGPVSEERVGALGMSLLPRGGCHIRRVEEVSPPWFGHAADELS